MIKTNIIKINSKSVSHNIYNNRDSYGTGPFNVFPPNLIKKKWDETSELTSKIIPQC
jgi:hypothetical protein